MKSAEMKKKHDKIEYLMFDGTVKTELTPEDQINCKGILVHRLFDNEQELLAFKKEWDKVNILNCGCSGE